jgi:hypothetical protein
MSKEENKVYGWDDVVNVEENTWNLMPAGTVVDFTVEAIEKKRNAKLNCPKMDIKLKCVNAECGETTVYENISLHSKAQYFINAFFTAIGFTSGDGLSFGQRAERAIGRRGRAKLKIDEWASDKVDDKGEPIIYQANKIDRYLKVDDPAPAKAANSDDIF